MRLEGYDSAPILPGAVRSRPHDEALALHPRDPVSTTNLANGEPPREVPSR